MAKSKQILEILSGGNLVFDKDQRNIQENYFEENNGTRNVGGNAIAVRDFGTKAIVHCPPIRPNAHIVITGATNVSPIVISTASTDGLQAGDTVFVDEIAGNTAANGKWVVGTVVANTSFELVGSTGNGAYTSGGIWCSPDTNTVRNPITIYKSFIFYDKENGLEYPIVFGIDSSSVSRVYAYDTASTEASKWIEMSRYFDALVNEGAGIGASDTNFDFDTLTENGVTYTGAADFVNNWIVVNTTQSNETVFITDSTASNLTVDTVVGSNGLGWANNDVLKIYRFPCFKFNWNASNGTSPHVDFHFIEDQRKLNILYANSSTPQVAYQAIQLMKRNERNYFYNFSSYEKTLPAGWYCESDFGILNPYMATEGSIDNPVNYSFSFAPQPVTAVSNTTPIEITRSGGHTFTTGDYIMIWSSDNYNVNGYWRITVTSGTTFTLDNSVASGVGTSGYILPVTNTSVYDTSSGRNWLSILTKVVDSAGTTSKGVRIYATATYDNYQESDAIFSGYYYNDGGSGSVQVFFNVLIDFALMNKNITDINIYGAEANTTIYDAGWANSSDEYYLIAKYDVQDRITTLPIIWNNIDYPTTQKKYYGWKPRDSYGGTVTDTNLAAFQTIDTAENSGATTLYDQLNHEIDKNRSYPTPRFAAITASGDGIVIVLDGGDNAFFIANHNGSGALEDDNFPDVRTNVAGSRLKVDTQGNGTVLGIEILNGIIYIIRSHVAEMYDLQGVFVDMLKIDCVSKDSIHTTPRGIMFAGKSGLDIIPIGGGNVETINQDWIDFYNGSEYVTGVTPYINDTYRSQIVAGYDETYKESWFKIEVATGVATSEFIMYRINEEGKWSERTINTDDTIKFFGNSRINKNFYITTNKSILVYPNRDGSYIYEDDVKINGAGTEYSQSNAVPFDITLNVAHFDDEVREKILDEFRLNFEGESTDTYGRVTIELYANDEETAFDTQTVRLDEIMDWRGVESVGELKRLRIRAYLADDTNLGKLNIKKILLKFLE